MSSDPSWLCAVHMHVDDLCIMGRNIQKFKDLINQHFEMEDLGACSFFLGMKVTRDLKAHTISLSQEHYIRNMLTEYDMGDCHSVNTPMIPNSHLIPATPDEEEAFQATGENYRRAVGLLNYLVQCTRPDLALAASQLSQFLDRPGTQHWAAFRRILRYLKGTQSLCLVLGGSKIDLVVYCDSDYAGCSYTGRSTTGYCTFIAGSCVSWRARKQPTVATSLTEAEYREAYEVGQETVWLLKLLEDLGYKQTAPTILKCNNQGAIFLQKNPLFQSRSRHFNNKFHWIREKVEDKTIEPIYINTSLMIADFLTKSVPKPKHEFCVKNVKLLSLVSEGGS